MRWLVVLARVLKNNWKLLLGLAAPIALLLLLMSHAWQLTVDDAYISFRYARNLSRGQGLVFNPGDRVEGYTNFLWTSLLAGVIRLGGDPVTAAKTLGGASAVGLLGLSYWLSNRVCPGGKVPALAPWLLASSVPLAGHAVFGLETAMFAALVLGGFCLVLVEVQARRRFPWSGLVFAVAFLTRPEASLYFVVTVVALTWGRAAPWRQSLTRIATFLLPAVVHTAWRKHYYGEWLPNTAVAKTGNLANQVTLGMGYLERYVTDAALPCGLALAGAVVLFVRGHRRESIGLALTLCCVAPYVVVVGGDWMLLHRSFVPLEAFCLVLSAVALRAAVERADAAAATVLGSVAVVLLLQRTSLAERQLEEIAKERASWDAMARPVAEWLVRQPRGAIALGDMGFIAYRTDYPILDLLGLVSPAIARLPGGYALRQGREFQDEVFESAPRYVVIIAADGGCTRTVHPTFATLFQDPKRRLMKEYHLAYRVNLEGGWGQCIYVRTGQLPGHRARQLFSFEGATYAPWIGEGDAFASGPQIAMAANHQPIVGHTGKKLCTSFHPVAGDAARGVLTSPPFVVDRDYMTLFVGGGRHPGTRVELWIGDTRRAVQMGNESEVLEPVSIDVREWRGHDARLRIVDEEVGPWGHILLDHVQLADEAPHGGHR